jgi:hypothetical protein
MSGHSFRSFGKAGTHVAWFLAGTNLVTQFFLPDTLGLAFHKLLLQDGYTSLLLLTPLNITCLHSRHKPGQRIPVQLSTVL